MVLPNQRNAEFEIVERQFVGNKGGRVQISAADEFEYLSLLFQCCRIGSQYPSFEFEHQVEATLCLCLFGGVREEHYGTSPASQVETVL